MLVEDRERDLQVLLEEYRMINNEILLYLKEMIRCFVYAAILVGVFLGVGVGAGDDKGSILKEIQQYLPYGLPVLAVYFLVLSYIRIGLTSRRWALEKRVNALMGSELLGLESFAARVQSHGFIKIGRAWYAKLPTPMLLLGLLIFAGAALVFGVGGITYEGSLFFYCLLACGLLALYVFFIYPRLAKRSALRKD